MTSEVLLSVIRSVRESLVVRGVRGREEREEGRGERGGEEGGELEGEGRGGR